MVPSFSEPMSLSFQHLPGACAQIFKMKVSASDSRVIRVKTKTHADGAVWWWHACKVSQTKWWCSFEITLPNPFVLMGWDRKSEWSWTSVNLSWNKLACVERALQFAAWRCTSCDTLSGSSIDISWNIVPNGVFLLYLESFVWKKGKGERIRGSKFTDATLGT